MALSCKKGVGEGPAPGGPPASSLCSEIVEAFISDFLTHTDDLHIGRSFLPEDWRPENLIRPVFGTGGADRRRVRREAIASLPSNGGKSEVAAALCLALMFTEPVSCSPDS